MQTKSEAFRGRLFVVSTIVILLTLSMLGCDSVSPTKPTNVNHSQSTGEKLGKATAPQAPLGGGSGNIYADVNLACSYVTFDEDEAATTVGPGATNFEFKYTISWYFDPGDPNAGANAYVVVDGQTYECPSGNCSSGWISSSGSNHPLYVYAVAAHGEGVCNLVSAHASVDWRWHN